MRGYRVSEQVGEGTFAIVYRATQPSVDRDVAIKQIRSEFADRPDFIRRFEAEAHLVARLEHPYIVPLYDYWREPGSAYLVMRHLPGGSLESSLRSGAWDLRATARMVEQIGSALVVAHRAGVVHRDVKPANILLDDDQNAYLTDFGIALDSFEVQAGSAALSSGSPAYASPEQLRGEPVGPSADVHGLAISVYETLTGRLPFPDESTQAELLQRQLHESIPLVSSTRPEIPAAVDDLLQRATAKQATDRIQTVGEFLAAFEAAMPGETQQSIGRGRATLVGVDERNPYKGLRAFDEADGADFAGRERLVDQLVEVLSEHRILTVAGPSGSGKSSVVRAGLLPALRRGALPGSAEWYVATLVPGRRPFEELEAALIGVAAEQRPNLIDILRNGERGIARGLRRILPGSGHLLLVVDQFEELFTRCEDEAERRQFLEGLASAVTDDLPRMHVVATLRADFYDRPLAYRSIAPLVRDGSVLVLPLTADELEQAIVAPAESVGCEFEPGLVAEIMADVIDQPGALPLLQYALTELFDRRVSRVLTRDAYHEIGGTTGALGIRAEEIYVASSEAEQAEARSVIGRLVTLGEGTEDTRRRVLRSELGNSAAANSLVDRLGAARLLSFDRDPTTREPTVEVAHEALIREWPRLRRWLDDDRDGLRTLRHLGDTARSWVASGRDPGELYRGGRLDGAEAWASTHADELNPIEHEFLAASLTAYREEEAAEQEFIERQVRSNRRLRVLITAVSVIAVLALIAGAVALQQRSRANRSADEADAAAADAADAQEVAETEATNAAEAQELAESEAANAAQAQADAEIRRMSSDALALRASDPALSMLVALAAYDIDPGPDTLGAVQSTLARTDGFLGFMATDLVWPFFQLENTYSQIEFLGDDTLVARAATSESLYQIDFWDVESRTLSGSLDVVTNQMAVLGADYVVAIDPFDNSRSADWVGEVILIDGATASEVRRMSVEKLLQVSADPAGRSLVVASAEGEVVVYDVGFEELQRWHLEASGPFGATDNAAGVRSLALVNDLPILGISPNQTTVTVTATAADNDSIDAESITVNDKIVALAPDGGFAWTVETDALGEAAGITNVESANIVIDHLAAAPDGTKVYASAPGLGVWEIDVRDGRVLGHRPPAQFEGTLHVTDDWVMAGLEVSDRDTELVEMSLRPLDARPPVTALSPSGNVVAIEGPEGIALWALDGSHLLARGAPLDGASTASLDRSGNRLAWADAPSGPFGLWNLDTRAPMSPELGEPETLSWTQAGDLMTFRFSGGYQTWDDDDFELIGSTGIAPLRWSTFAPSPDHRFGVLPGHYLSLEAGKVKIYDLARGELVHEIDGFFEGGSLVNDQVEWIDFSDDGSLMTMVTAGGSAGMVETDGWDGFVQFELAGGQATGSVAISHDGSTVALHDQEGVLHLLDLDSGAIEPGPSVGMPPTDGGMKALAFGPDDTTILVGRDDGLQIFDIATGRPIGGTFANDSLLYGTPSYDGLHAITGWGNDLLVWNLDTQQWPDIVCRAAGRDITEEEWAAYAPEGEPYRSVCAAG